MQMPSNQRQNIRPILQEAITEFAKAIGYNRPLTVSDPYYPYDNPNGDKQYPNADDPGCYVFANGSGKVLYIGKSARYMGNRIWVHVGRKQKVNEQEIFPDAESWVKENQPDIGVWSIAVLDEHWWLASALEGYLSEKFLPERSRQV